jgi:hypothetical protein
MSYNISRALLQHADRTFHDVSGNVKHHDTGYWIVDMDQNSPHSVKSFVPELANVQLVEEDCVQQVYCGMPYLMPALSFIWYVFYSDLLTSSQHYGLFHEGHFRLLNVVFSSRLY